MNISAPFIRRPVGTALLTVAVALAGMVAYLQLPVALTAARANLPANLPNHPPYRKVNPADAPIMILALTSGTYGRAKLYDAASTIIQQRLLQVQGVGQVNIGGGALPAVRVDVNPTQLNSFGLGLEDVRTMLSQQNANLPKGQLADDHTTADILASDQLLKA